MDWYPENKNELNSLLDRLFADRKGKAEIHGIIVPHAGYPYSGLIAGKAFSLLKNKKFDRAVVIGPSHYSYLDGVMSSDKKIWETPLGKVKIASDGFKQGVIHFEHSIKNQLPFLQKLNSKVEVLPLMAGDINNNSAGEVAKKLAKMKVLFVFSTDLSHFLPYEQALKRDKNSIDIIEKLDVSRFKEIDACGKNCLLILFYLCKLKGWKPKLIEYENSGDVTGDKAGVVGYASFWF